jgi:hypothetical protein
MAPLSATPAQAKNGRSCARQVRVAQTAIAICHYADAEVGTIGIGMRDRRTSMPAMRERQASPAGALLTRAHGDCPRPCARRSRIPTRRLRRTVPVLIPRRDGRSRSGHAPVTRQLACTTVRTHRVARPFGGPERHASADTATDRPVRVPRTRKGADDGGRPEWSTALLTPTCGNAP